MHSLTNKELFNRAVVLTYELASKYAESITAEQDIKDFINAVLDSDCNYVLYGAECYSIVGLCIDNETGNIIITFGYYGQSFGTLIQVSYVGHDNTAVISFDEI